MICNCNNFSDKTDRSAPPFALSKFIMAENLQRHLTGSVVLDWTITGLTLFISTMLLMQIS